MAKLLAFNWKMNPAKLNEALDLAKASDYKNVVVIPPFPFIEEVAKVLKRAELGAQDLVPLETAPALARPKGLRGGLSLTGWTGEVSSEQLKNLCVNYVIVGHSERRHKLGESDEVVAKKLKAALDAGLIPILCVGETKAEKDAGKRDNVLERQLKSAFSGLKLKTKNLKLFVAYEPVWAIGTGEPETPESAVEAIKYIKQVLVKSYKLKVKVLYGGSVNSKNLKDYLKHREIDGALVGGASLKKEEVKKMVELI